MAIGSALDLIGRTPLVRLERVTDGAGGLLAKAEFLQPGGSVKDRAARQILDNASRDGRLRPGQPVVEMTSGNMGAGLAIVCAVRGNPFTAVMPAGNSPERARMLRALGAEVVLSPQVDGAAGEVTGADVARAEATARRIAGERGAFYVDQFNDPGSIEAHERGTGPELWADTGGRLDAFVAAVGSGGTFVGIARFLKAANPAVRCIAVEPEGAAVLAGKPVTRARHRLQGIGYGRIPPHWDPRLADGYEEVSDAEALRTLRALAAREGLFVGFSAAANVAAALRVLRRLGRSAAVATVLCDTGLKYSLE